MAAKIETAKFKPTQRKPQPITGELDFADKNLDPGILDIEIERLMTLEEAGALDAKEQNKLLFLIQQKKDRTINDLLNQFDQGMLDEQGQQDLQDLIEEKKLQTTSGTDYGSLEPKLIKADKAYAQDLSLIRPILDVSDEAGKKLQKKLIEKHYGPLGLAAHQNSSTGKWTAQYSNKQQHTLPGANLGEDIKRFGTSLAGGLLPNLIPGGGGKALGKIAGLAAARIAGAGGIEGFIKQRQEADAYNAAVEMGLLKPEEVKNISKKTTIPFVDMQIPESFTQGAIEVVQEVADALGIVQTTPGRAGSTQVYSQATRDPITGEFLTSSLDFPATANARQIIDLGIPFQGPEIPGTGFTESLIQGAPTELPTSSVRVPGAKKTTTIKPSNKDIITGEVQGTITPDKYLDGYEAISRLADEAQMTNPRLYNKLVEAKVAYQKPLIKTNAQNQLLAAEDVAEFAGKQTKAGFTTFKSTPKIPEGAAGIPFTQVKLGFQTLEDGYTALPVKVRTKFSGTSQEVNDKVFNQNGSLKLKTADAKQVNQAVINNYGEAAEARLKDIADSSIDQAVFRAKPQTALEGYVGSKVTPELFEKARAVTPQQQKALQAKGVSLNLGEQAKAAQAGTGELTSKLNIKKTEILNQSSRDQEALSALVGPQNYAESQKPVMELFTLQQAPTKPTTAMGKLKGKFQEAGQAKLATDVGVGGLIGTGIGGTVGLGVSAMLPGVNAATGGGIGAGLGGLTGAAAGAAFRPAARATGSFIQQIPEAISRTPVLRELPSFIESPVGQMLGKGITAGTTASFVNPEEEQNILQQILRTRKFTNGNY